MSSAQLIGGLPNTSPPSFAASTFGPIGSGWFPGEGITSSSESAQQMQCGSGGGTFSLMAGNMLSNSLSATLTLRFRVNTANGNEVVNISAGSNGVFQDTTHSDVMSSGDLSALDITTTDTTNTANLVNWSVLYTASSNTVTTMTEGLDTGSVFTSTGATDPMPLMGIWNGVNSEADNQIIQPFAAVLSNGQVEVTTNSKTNASLAVTRKSSATQNISVSMTGGSTGLFSDTSHTDTITASDLWCAATITGSTSGSLVFNVCGFDYVSSSGNFPLCGQSVFSGFRSFTHNTTSYTGIGAHFSTETTENLVQAPALAAFTFSNLGLFVTSNGVTATSNVTLRDNGTNTTVTFAIGSGSVGQFQDTTDTYVPTALDLMSIGVVAGSSGTNFKASTVNAWGTSSGGTLHTASISETETVSEAVAKKASLKAIAESETVSETEVKKALKHIADSNQTVTESIKKKALKHIAESETVTELVVKKAGKHISDSSGSISESVSNGTTVVISISDSLGGAISETVKKKLKHNIAETATTALESIKKLAKKHISEQNQNVSELIGGFYITGQILETVAVTVIRAGVKVRTIVDSLGGAFSDAIAAVKIPNPATATIIPILGTLGGAVYNFVSGRKNISINGPRPDVDVTPA